MKYSIRQKLIIFSIVILACSIFIGSAIYEGNQKVIDTEQWVQHTEQVINESGSILSQTKDIETASRGFVITNDSAYLEPLFISEKVIITSVGRLRQLTLDNPAQQQRIDSLDLYVHKRLDFSQQMIQLRSKQGLAEAAAFTSTNQGWKDGDHIRKIIDAIQTEENGLLKERRLDNERSASTFNRFSVILFIALLVFTILLLVGTGNYWVQEKRSLETEQLNAELEQKVIDRTANMDKYKYFFYNTLDMACFANLDGYFEELNGSFTKALGYTVQDLMDKKFYEFIHPDDVEATLKVVEKLSSGASAVNFTNRYKTKSNTYQHLEWNAIFNSKTRKICAIARNVTERMIAHNEVAYQNDEKGKRAAELIIANKELAFQNNEKENRAAELIIANKELAFQNDEKEKRAAELVIANTELAFQNKEKENRAVELIVANKELAFQNQEKENRAAELTIANKELAFQSEEKEKRAAELAIANDELAFQNNEKEKRAAELTMANKELKKAEDHVRKLNEELEQKVVKRTAELELVNKELESFSYSISHDLRAPLRAIHGYAQMLKEDYGIQLDTEANRIMNNVMNSAKKMGRLIDDLLAFSRLGRKELVKVNIPMYDMVKDICREIKDENGERNIQFNVDELEPAQGDTVAIKQAWVNLISNAVKYSKLKDKAVIEIGSGEKGNDIVYYVKDNGAGFDMRYANKLFGVFQRLHTDDKFEGTGVGLAIVHRIVSKHGGKIWAEAKVDEGATFYFSLPKNK